MVDETSPIKQAVVRLIELSADEKARALYEAREKERRDNRAREKSARREGQRDEKLAIAQNALRKNMLIEDIMDITGLTREEIEGLRN